MILTVKEFTSVVTDMTDLISKVVQKAFKEVYVLEEMKEISGESLTNEVMFEYVPVFEQIGTHFLLLAKEIEKDLNKKGISYEKDLK